MADSNKLIIFDTTLRDGEQSPGASMTKDEKIRIARQLERLKVDVIEAGFAASSPGDFEAIKAIAGIVKDSVVCSLSRANDKDISRAACSPRATAVTLSRLTPRAASSARCWAIWLLNSARRRWSATVVSCRSVAACDWVAAI